MAYRDRDQAGKVLAKRLRGYAGRSDVVVLALVRGGVPVAAPIASALHVPLDVLVVRKLGVPWAPEVAFGAMGPGGIVVHNRDVEAHLTPAEMGAVLQGERTELARRETRYREGREPLDLTGRTAIIVDDGLATGATARAAVAVARHLGAARVVVAVPVGSREALKLLTSEADEVICALVPRIFGAVGRYYTRFAQVTDDEVGALLAAR